jgi:ABC-type branched-subunit amino acid transport system substrate-binding protein
VLIVRARVVLIFVAMALLASACSVHRLDDEQALGASAGDRAAERPGATGVEGTSGDAPASSGEGGPARGTTVGSAGEGAPSAPLGNQALDPSVPRTASDRGVTEDEMLLGILHTADSFFAATGQETKNVARVIAPFIKEVNEQGGINGRTVLPRISTYDPLSAESMNAACVQQAEDHKVFASIAQIGYYGDAEICMATKQVPLLTFNNSTEKTNVEREKGWVRQTNQNKDRNIKNWIDWMIQAGLVNNATKTGLIYVDVPEDRDLVHGIVLPYIESKGLRAPELATLSASIAQTPSESQSAVLQFKSAGVEMVLPLVSFLRILIFAEQAEASDYRPEYSVSDFGLLSTDAMAGMPPSQWEGVRGITVLPTGVQEPGALPPSANFQECHRVYKKYGEDFAPHPDDPSRPEGIEVANMMHYCQHVALFAEAARRAGVNPTRRSYLAQFDSLGTWNHRVVLSERLTFGPRKYDGADLYAVIQWRSGCNSDGGCYRQIEGFRPGAW